MLDETIEIIQYKDVYKKHHLSYIFSDVININSLVGILAHLPPCNIGA